MQNEKNAVEHRDYEIKTDVQGADYSNLVSSIFLVNLESGSIITEGQFVFFDVLMENITTFKIIINRTLITH